MMPVPLQHRLINLVPPSNGGGDFLEVHGPPRPLHVSILNATTAATFDALLALFCERRAAWSRP
jgi:hypothetical protein